MGNKSKPGQHYYKKLGLTSPMAIHMTPALKAKLKAIAEKEERSLQVTVRRILEAYVKQEITSSRKS